MLLGIVVLQKLECPFEKQHNYSRGKDLDRACSSQQCGINEM